MKHYLAIDETLVEVRIEVPLGAQGLRLDRFIQRHIPRLSRTRVQDIIARGVFDQDGKTAKASRLVRTGEHYWWRRQVVPEPVRDFDLPIIFEDARFLVLNKPGDIVVHPTAKVWRHTVTAWLREHRPEAKIAHRLDRETSGVLVCGKGAHGAWLKASFRESQVQKTYLAIVRGAPDFDTKRVELPLALDETSPLKVKMRVAPGGLHAVTDFEVLERRDDWALVRCAPLTGRQHQIRVHLWALGHPILGDKLYGVSEEIFKESAELGVTARVLEAAGAPRHMLHAAKLEIKGPEGEPLCFEAGLHEDMARWLAAR